MKVAILTVSSSGAKGSRKDTSGDAIAEWAKHHEYDVVARSLVPDDPNAIVRALLEWSDSGDTDLVLTTGGTGLSPTDVTPEATRTVLERETPGISELLRGSAMTRFPRAALARGVSGVRNRTLIVNLPGSPGGVKDSLVALNAIVEHAVAVMRGEIADHDVKTGSK